MELLQSVVEGSFEPPCHPSDGWFTGARACPSPNFDPRPGRGGGRPRHRSRDQPASRRVRGGAITRLFCDELDPSEHPAFGISGGSGSRRTPSSTGPARSPSTCRFSTAPGTRGRRTTATGPGATTSRSASSWRERTRGPTNRASTRRSRARPRRDGPMAVRAPRPGRWTLGRRAGRKTDPGPAFDWGGFRRLLDRA